MSAAAPADELNVLLEQAAERGATKFLDKVSDRALPIRQQFVRLRPCAEMLGISEGHLSHLVRDGKAPPSVRLGTARLFNVADAIAWLRAQAA